MKPCIKTWHVALALFLLAGILHYTSIERFSITSHFDTPVEARATPTVNLLLGGFRGVVADWLWLRAMMLQEQGRFIEIIQLAEWITALQPQFPDVWTLHAWNLAYNITVLLPDGAERYRWVRHGYEILRDQAIPATRYHPRICAELAWILMHKIGGTSDDFADTFFQKWYETYVPLLAPDGTISPDEFKRKSFYKESGFPARKRQTFEQQYGRHDWRHPLTHAAAWAYIGFVDNPYKSETIMAERFFLQSYRQLLFYGKIHMDEISQTMSLKPDVSRITSTLDILAEAYQRGRHPEIETIYLQTLERAIQLLVSGDHLDKARNIYARLVEAFPSSISAHRGFEALAALPFSPEPRVIPISE